MSGLRRRLAALPIDLDSYQLDQLELFIAEERKQATIEALVGFVELSEREDDRRFIAAWEAEHR